VVRKLACAFLLTVGLCAVFADQLAPAHYATQFREMPNAGPSRQHLLGTDDVGRDRFSRILYGTRISLVLAPAAALLSTLMAALIGGVAGYLGGFWARCAMGLADLFL
jgi:ABC-type dipeptide/oligopeptide/nickel transport system permease subunit